jgi:hypothetical protein
LQHEGARRRRPRGILRRPRNERAVSGVVAASLGVVLISVLLGMVVTFWVPAWGYDSEVAHSREVVNAFSEFKKTLELQALSGNLNQTLTTTFPLGVGGVPLFGAETPGELFHSYLDQGRPRFRANLTDLTGQVNFTAVSSLEYFMPNRYYIPQRVAYESGAVIVSQSDGETVRLTPPFRFENGTSGVDAYFTLFTLDGPEIQVSGVEGHATSSRVSLVQTRSVSFAADGTITLNVTTQFSEAWVGYFARAMNASSIAPALFNITSSAPNQPEWATLRVSGVRAVTVTVALVEVRIE